MKNFILIVTNIFFFLSGYAQEFRLDTTFGEQGIVTTQTNHTSEIYDVAHSPDGRIIAVGANVVTQFQMCAYLPNGELDRTFGEEGFVQDNSYSQGIPFAALVQPNHKILVCCASSLLRFLPNGKYDFTFGNNGMVKIQNFGSLPPSISIIHLQQDGKIVCAGNADGQFLLMRFNVNGSPDSSFGNNGTVMTSFKDDSYILSLTIQKDNKIVVSGATGEFPNSEFALARYSSNGEIDTAFGIDGTITTAFSSSPFENSYASEVKIIDDKILVIGSANGRLAFVRYDSNGALDNTFANNGVYINDTLPHATDIAILPNDRILLSGITDVSKDNASYSMLQFNKNGSLDTSFGKEGQLILDLANGDDYAQCLETITDSEIIIAGSSKDSSSTPSKFALAKFVFDGANSISDAKSLKPWAIHPNPSASYFTLRSNQTITTHHRIELFNALGQSVLKQNISSSTTTVDIRNMPEGIYFYKLFSSKDIVQQGKIEKQ